MKQPRPRTASGYDLRKLREKRASGTFLYGVDVIPPRILWFKRTFYARTARFYQKYSVYIVDEFAIVRQPQRGRGNLLEWQANHNRKRGLIYERTTVISKSRLADHEASSTVAS